MGSEVHVNITGLLVDAFGRIRRSVHDIVEEAADEELVFRVDAEANSIAWLVWHLTRIQDDHVAKAWRTDQIWTTGGWADRFALPFAAAATGYGQSSDDVAAIAVGADLLTTYHDAVYEQTTNLLGGLSDADLDRIVDENWDPPVSLGVRLVSVVADDLQHVGQAAFILGLSQRRRPSST